MVRLILNGRCIDDENADPLPHDFCLPGGRVALSPDVLPLLREVVGVPALTAEEVQVALAVRDLESARKDGVIAGWDIQSPGCREHAHWDCHLYTSAYENISRHEQRQGGQADAMIDALECIAQLRAEAEAKKSPEPEAMEWNLCCSEMNDREWRLQENVWWLQWSSMKHRAVVSMREGETLADFHRRALRRARELAQQA